MKCIVSRGPKKPSIMDSMDDSVKKEMITRYLCTIKNSSDFFFEEDLGQEPNPYDNVVDILTRKVIVAICVLGLIGNILNLIILIPLGFRSPLGRIERCAYSGLVALASSDLFFCIFVIPRSFALTLERANSMSDRMYFSVTFDLVYKTYENALINICVLSSTWLTVSMAIGRYLAICHPLWARESIGPTMAKRAIFLVVITCIALNIPRFWVWTILKVTCPDGGHVYMIEPGHLQNNQTAGTVYNWFYFAIGIALPFIILLSSNIWLIRALRSSHATQHRNRERRTQRSCDANRMITLTMIIIIVMYITLVSPAEFAHFLVQYTANDHEQQNHNQYNLMVVIFNTMQAVNFAFNFVLYFAINVSFRRSLVRMMCCHQPTQSARQSTISHRSTASTDVSLRQGSRISDISVRNGSRVSSLNGSSKIIGGNYNLIEMTV